MATSIQIDAAARTPKAPHVDTLDLGRVDLFPDATPQEYVDAHRFVRRMANRHHCRGAGCKHRNHKRDVEAAKTALILLGLADDPVPSVERKPDVSPVVTPTPMTRRQKAWQMVEKTILPGADRSWMDDAGCQGEDLNLFFAPDGERQPEREIREQKAKAVCAACPVKAECLDYAVSRPEKYGTWGSLNEDERAGERRRRMRRANAA